MQRKTLLSLAGIICGGILMVSAIDFSTKEKARSIYMRHPIKTEENSPDFLKWSLGGLLIIGSVYNIRRKKYKSGFYR